MLEDTLGVEPSAGLAWQCLSITAALAAALPAARWYAGVQGGEASASRRAGTLRAGFGTLAWLALTGGLAGSGALANFDRFPPPLMPLLLGSFALTFGVAFSSFGRRLAEHLPLALIVGFQGFRVAVEVMLHQASVEGVIGAQMTWSGLNFDVVSGITGLGLGLWLWKRGDARADEPRALLWGWSVLGLGLLLTIVSIAVMSIPGPLRLFDGPPNVWIATVPFVWLPTMMVMAALLGHLLLLRRLLGARPGRS